MIEKSTLPVRTAHSMKIVLEANDKGLKFQILSNPEFLAEGPPSHSPTATTAGTFVTMIPSWQARP